jgi:hypothetical protein
LSSCAAQVGMVDRHHVGDGLDQWRAIQGMLEDGVDAGIGDATGRQRTLAGSRQSLRPIALRQAHQAQARSVAHPRRCNSPSVPVRQAYGGACVRRHSWRVWENLQIVKLV